MTNGRYSRRNASFRPTGVRRSDRENNFFLAIVGFSLLSHIIVAALFLYTPATTSKRRPPTLSVDLVMAPPVANPQRGSAGAIKKSAEPVAVEKVPVLPSKVVEKEIILKEFPKSTKEMVDDPDKSIADMRKRRDEQREFQNTQKAIAAMGKKVSPTPQAAAAGSVSETGDEDGGGINIWIYEKFRSKWKLSKYQIKNPNLKVSLMIEYDKNGTLINSKFQWSGDRAFDDSIRKAFEIFSKEKLPATFLVGAKKNFGDKIILTPNELFEK